MQSTHTSTLYLPTREASVLTATCSLHIQVHCTFLHEELQCWLLRAVYTYKYTVPSYTRSFSVDCYVHSTHTSTRTVLSYTRSNSMTFIVDSIVYIHCAMNNTIRGTGTCRAALDRAILCYSQQTCDFITKYCTAFVTNKKIISNTKETNK